MTPEADRADSERADSDYTGWRVDARCRTADPQLFFPESNVVANQQNRYAKGYCFECTVSTECLVYGRHEPYGIWGGYTYNERKPGGRKREEVNARIANYRALHPLPARRAISKGTCALTVDDLLRSPISPHFRAESSWRDDL